MSIPAREVGGDFFNYFALENGHVALIVGDVSGKGVGAALLMANIQASLRTRLALGQSLADIAEAIDRDLAGTATTRLYVTLFLGVFDPATRGLSYVNAGHNPQFVLRPNQPIEKMEATGIPIGLLAGRGYAERKVNLASGDLLFFYTDGCVETENESRRNVRQQPARAAAGVHCHDGPGYTGTRAAASGAVRDGLPRHPRAV